MITVTTTRISGAIPLLLLSILPLSLSAQTPVPTDRSRTITGIVLGAESGEALPGATIELVQFDSTGASTRLGVGMGADVNGRFRLVSPVALNLGLRVSALGHYATTLKIADTEDSVVVRLYASEADFEPAVEITGVRRSRSVEDGCCRVESIQEEVQQHAPFNSSPIESLRRYSSCTFGRTVNTIDGLGTISLRGLEPTRVGMLLDGAPVYTGPGTFYGPTLIPSHALQTIVIAEGASSGRYGEGALSGVVDMQTRQPTELDELTGSFNLLGDETGPDQYDLNLGYTGMVGNVGLALFGSYNEHAVTTPGDPSRLTTLSRDYRRFSGLAKMNLLIDPKTELVGTLLGGREERTGTVADGEVTPFERSVGMNRFDGLLSLARLIGDDGEVRVKGSFSRLDLSQDAGVDIGQSLIYGEAVLTEQTGDHSLEVGLGGRSDNVTSEGRDDLSYDNGLLFLYAQDVVALGEDVSLLGSLRLDHHSGPGLTASPRLAISYALTNDISMRLMAGEGFRGEGTFDEDYRTLFGTLTWRPNRELDHEVARTINYDVNWSWVPSTSVGLSGNLNFYYTAITGRMTADTDSLEAGTLFLRNSSEPAFLRGFEWQSRANFEGGLGVSVAFSLIDYRRETPSGEQVRVDFSPGFNLDGVLTWQNDDLGLLVEGWGSLVGPQSVPYDVDGENRSPAYTLLNLRVEKEIGPIGFYLGAQNLLDERQVDHSPLIHLTAGRPEGTGGWGPLEGREFFTGVRWRIGGE